MVPRPRRQFADEGGDVRADGMDEMSEKFREMGGEVYVADE